MSAATARTAAPAAKDEESGEIVLRYNNWQTVEAWGLLVFCSVITGTVLIVLTVILVLPPTCESPATLSHMATIVTRIDAHRVFAVKSLPYTRDDVLLLSVAVDIFDAVDSYLLRSCGYQSSDCNAWDEGIPPRKELRGHPGVVIVSDLRSYCYV